MSTFRIADINFEMTNTTASGKGTVLVAVDDSEASLRLVDFVAKTFPGYEVILTHVHCNEVYPGAGGSGGAYFAQDNQSANNEASEEREVMFMKDTLCPRLEAAGVKPKTELVRIMAAGNKAIANALCKRAENLKPDFLVLSKRSKNAVTMFFVGSCTQDCIRHAPCPIVVV